MDLIAINSRRIGEQEVRTVNARDLHAFLEVRRDFTNWIKARIKQYGFTDGVDYAVFDSPVLANQSGRGGDRRSVEYVVTIDMAKELSMVERTQKGREVRRYFIECERVALAYPSITREVHGRMMAFERRDKLTHAMAQLGSRHMLERKEALRELREEKALLEEITQLRLALGGAEVAA